MLPVTTSDLTRSGYRAARHSAIVPPQLLQTKSADAIPSSSSNATVFAAWKSHIGPVIRHLSDLPYCRRSTIRQRRSAANSGATGPKSLQPVQPGPPPCRKTVSGPDPTSR